MCLMNMYLFFKVCIKFLDRIPKKLIDSYYTIVFLLYFLLFLKVTVLFKKNTFQINKIEFNKLFIYQTDKQKSTKFVSRQKSGHSVADR